MTQGERSCLPIQMRSANFFNLPNPSSRSKAQGSPQLLAEMNTTILPGEAKGCHCVRLTTSPPPATRVLEVMGDPDVAQNYGPPGPVTETAFY
jgi:hypothetical protein